jgi:hypothetical protein
MNNPSLSMEIFVSTLVGPRKELEFEVIEFDRNTKDVEVTLFAIEAVVTFARFAPLFFASFNFLRANSRKPNVISLAIVESKCRYLLDMIYLFIQLKKRKINIYPLIGLYKYELVPHTFFFFCQNEAPNLGRQACDAYRECIGFSHE